jgi:hypothetical protein
VRPPFDTLPVGPPPFDTPVGPLPFEAPPFETPPFGLGGGVLGDAGDSLAANSIGRGSPLALGNISAVPEPSMLVVLFSGGLILVAAAWRRRRGR